MSRCLTDDQLQAIADHEAPLDHVAHAEQCHQCAGRLAARARLLGRVEQAVGSEELGTARRTAILAQVAQTTAGATTLRPVRRLRPRVWAVPLAAAAAIALFVYVIPGIDRQTTVSAAEILGRSRTALAAQSSGIEVLTYNLEVSGVLADLIPEEQSGRFTVQELVDHDHQGRYRIVKLTSGGQVVGGAADDPLRGTRARYMRANGRGYLLKFEGAAPTAFSIPALKRTALQTFIGFMQASTTQTLRQLQRGSVACYQIDIPGAAMVGGSLIALDNARAVVTVADSQLVEFSAAGRIADQPFMVNFALLSQDRRPADSASAADFDIAPEAGDVVLEGDASQNPVWDVVFRALREIPADAPAQPKPSLTNDHPRR